MAWCSSIVFLFQFRPRSVGALLHFSSTFVFNGIIHSVSCLFYYANSVYGMWVLFFNSTLTIVFNGMISLDYFPVLVPFTEFKRLLSFPIHLRLHCYDVSQLLSCAKSIHGIWMLIIKSHPPSSSMTLIILNILLLQFRP